MHVTIVMTFETVGGPCHAPYIVYLSQGDESHKADEYIRFIKKDKDQLPDAVLQCIKAAGEEFDPPMQQSLLKVYTGQLALLV